MIAAAPNRRPSKKTPIARPAAAPELKEELVLPFLPDVELLAVPLTLDTGNVDVCELVLRFDQVENGVDTLVVRGVNVVDDRVELVREVVVLSVGSPTVLVVVVVIPHVYVLIVSATKVVV
jgi:hypothetical protein